MESMTKSKQIRFTSINQVKLETTILFLINALLSLCFEYLIISLKDSSKDQNKNLLIGRLHTSLYTLFKFIHCLATLSGSYTSLDISLLSTVKTLLLAKCWIAGSPFGYVVFCY
jgi:hypothetical protein